MQKKRQRERGREKEKKHYRAAATAFAHAYFLPSCLFRVIAKLNCKINKSQHVALRRSFNHYSKISRDRTEFVYISLFLSREIYLLAVSFLSSPTHKTRRFRTLGFYKFEIRLTRVASLPTQINSLNTNSSVVEQHFRNNNVYAIV